MKKWLPIGLGIIVCFSMAWAAAPKVTIICDDVRSRKNGSKI